MKPRYGMTKERRFWIKVIKTDTCWEWRGAASPQGYGMFCSGWGANGVELAHRFAYRTLVGPIPEGMTLDHTCDNKLCVNPDHLEPCTQKENVRRYHKRRREDAIRAAQLRQRATFAEAEARNSWERETRQIMACIYRSEASPYTRL